LLSPVKSSLMVNGSFHEVMPIELEKTLRECHSECCSFNC
jgi:hypothetical protein